MVLITEYAPLGSLDKLIEEVEDDITADHKMVIISQVRVEWRCAPLPLPSMQCRYPAAFIEPGMSCTHAAKATLWWCTRQRGT